MARIQEFFKNIYANDSGNIMLYVYITLAIVSLILLFYIIIGTAKNKKKQKEAVIIKENPNVVEEAKVIETMRPVVTEDLYVKPKIPIEEPNIPEKPVIKEEPIPDFSEVYVGKKEMPQVPAQPAPVASEMVAPPKDPEIKEEEAIFNTDIFNIIGQTRETVISPEPKEEVLVNPPEVSEPKSEGPTVLSPADLKAKLASLQKKQEATQELDKILSSPPFTNQKSNLIEEENKTFYR